jgi:hypothetical protein
VAERASATTATENPIAGTSLESFWSALTPATRRLKPFGVLIRYPGNDASKSQAKQALIDCKAIRCEVRLSFGLKN